MKIEYYNNKIAPSAKRRRVSPVSSAVFTPIILLLFGVVSLGTFSFAILVDYIRSKSFMEMFSSPKLSYQSAFAPSKLLKVENWTLKSRTLTSPRSLDQCGGPRWSTGVAFDGTVQDTGLSFIPTNAHPPPSVCTSHQIYCVQENEKCWSHGMRMANLWAIT